MAAAELDKRWEDWTTRLTGSYAQSLDLLEQGKADDAALKFRAGFLFTVKQIFSESADVYPKRFEGSDCWSAWTRRLYRLSRSAEDAFKSGKIDQAKNLLPELRRHFYDLHRQSDTIKSNDALFAVVDAMAMDDAAAEMISNAVEKLVAADPCRKAKADGDAYKKARDQWFAEIQPALQDNRLTPEERVQLRNATLPFYKTYGLGFE